ncbi:hypothetical protein [uncultured Allobaculum sp.]|uniref:hypothetical protein n=1 Tax=uncultured Allobaculum sp. TaxID=1187017 RepID=UPI00258FAD8E|nr:hypothetical protein [uncultured Allobaculum sp.]
MDDVKLWYSFYSDTPHQKSQVDCRDRQTLDRRAGKYGTPLSDLSCRLYAQSFFLFPFRYSGRLNPQKKGPDPIGDFQNRHSDPAP